MHTTISCDGVVRDRTKDWSGATGRFVEFHSYISRGTSRWNRLALALLVLGRHAWLCSRYVTVMTTRCRSSVAQNSGHKVDFQRPRGQRGHHRECNQQRSTSTYVFVDTYRPSRFLYSHILLIVCPLRDLKASRGGMQWVSQVFGT